MEKDRSEIKLSVLFKEMFIISCFTFGGGYVMIGLMKEKFVDDLKWIDEDEELDMIAIAQSAPGAMAINSAIMLGYSLKGLKGALISVLGVLIPPIFIIAIAAYFYDMLMGNQVFQVMLQVTRAAVAAVIVSVVIDLAKDVVKKKDVFNIILMIATFVASYFFKVSVVHIILICIALGIAATYIEKRKGNV